MRLYAETQTRPIIGLDPTTTSDFPESGMTAPEHAFPTDDYTPHGYLDNPYHTMRLNPSGVIRSRPAVGFGWWVRAYPGSPYGKVFAYAAHLNIGIRLGDKVLLTPEDFERERVTLSSPYHTKNLFTYAWELDGVQFSVRFFLEQEDALAAIVEMENSIAFDLECRLFAVVHYTRRLDTSGFWEEGLTARYEAEREMFVARAFSEGTLIGLASGAKPAGCLLGLSEAEVRRAMADESLLKAESGPHDSLVATGGAERTNTVVGALAFDVPLKGESTETLALRLIRSETEAGLRELRAAGDEALEAQVTYKLADDDAFWSKAVRLGGDFPPEWRRGFVYDIETLRMNVREPVGIYTHRWDAMQVQGPRSVLAEAAIDAMLLSYSDPALAREVLLGTFADAPEPWVPCTREDGSYNMIAYSGHGCGTAPEWGAPLGVIEMLYRREPDREWLAELYPRLVAYVEWWRENRSGDEGFAHYLCSYESGQDMSWRFGHQLGGGDDITRIRPVDLMAAMAHSYGALATFAHELNKKSEAKKWKAHGDAFAARTEKLWHDGWYHDYDREKGGFTHGRDVMHLAPFFYRLAPAEHAKAVSPLVETMCTDRRPEWPMFTFMLVEAAFEIGLRKPMAELARRLVDHIYAVTDARTQGPKMPLPGVQHEFWPESRTWGAEGYGWGAFSLFLVIRTMFGFRERLDNRPGFVVAPSVPKSLMQPDRVYIVHNLKAHGYTFDLAYTVVDKQWLEVEVKFAEGAAPAKVRASDARNDEVLFQGERPASVPFSAKNFGAFNVLFET